MIEARSDAVKSKVRCCIGTWNVRSMNQGKLEVVDLGKLLNLPSVIKILGQHLLIMLTFDEGEKPHHFLAN